MTEQTIPAPQSKKRSPLQRLGCGVLLVIWFAMLMLPCFLGILATQGQITISTGNAPGQELRIWLIMEPFERGLGISSASARYDGDNRFCLDTSVNYLMWAGNVEPSPYTECYERENANAAWTFISADSNEDDER